MILDKVLSKPFCFFLAGHFIQPKATCIGRVVTTACEIPREKNSAHHSHKQIHNKATIHLYSAHTEIDAQITDMIVSLQKHKFINSTVLQNLLTE